MSGVSVGSYSVIYFKFISAAPNICISQSDLTAHIPFLSQSDVLRLKVGMAFPPRLTKPFEGKMSRMTRNNKKGKIEDSNNELVISKVIH